MKKISLMKLIRPLVEQFPVISLVYRQIRDARAISKDPKLTKLGFKFYGNEFMENGLFEPIETNLVKKIFPKVDIVINVGANIGYYVCQALQNKKKVIAFEPMESNLKYLMKNLMANGWQEDCEIFPVALSNKADIIKIYGGGTGASLIKGWAGTPEEYATLVPCLAMDAIFENRFEGKRIFIIIDIEGAESSMLDGATKLLNMNPRPYWLIEIAGKEHQPKGIKLNPKLLETFEKFWNRGYESVAVDNKLRKISRDEITKIVETQVDSLMTHNFLFYEKNKSPIN